MLQRVLQLALLWTIVPTLVKAQTYSSTTLDYPGATLTTPNAINRAGLVTGSYVDSASATHGFVHFNGTFVTFDVPNAKFTALHRAALVIGGWRRVRPDSWRVAEKSLL